jgi:hypothetical protein
VNQWRGCRRVHELAYYRLRLTLRVAGLWSARRYSWALVAESADGVRI